jgi:soluble lytic murein transglycosylase-like protein
MRRFFRNFAQGTHCLSVGTLTLGLGFGALLPPGGPTGEPAAAPFSVVLPSVTTPPPLLAAVVTPTPTPAPAAPVPAEPQQPVVPAPAEKPAPAVETPKPEAVPAPAPPAPAPAPVAPKPKPRPSAMHFLDTHEIPPGPFGKLIFEVAARYSLNPHLVAAIVRVESSFNPRAISRKGACGLMQLLPETARRFGLRRKDLFDPAKNLEAGARYLKWLSDRFGHDPVRVLAAYNAGEGAVQRYGGVPPYRETRNYVQRIFSMLGLDSAPEAAKTAPAETALAR